MSCTRLKDIWTYGCNTESSLALGNILLTSPCCAWPDARGTGGLPAEMEPGHARGAEGGLRTVAMDGQPPAAGLTAAAAGWMMRNNMQRSSTPARHDNDFTTALHNDFHVETVHTAELSPSTGRARPSGRPTSSMLLAIPYVVDIPILKPIISRPVCLQQCGVCGPGRGAASRCVVEHGNGERGVVFICGQPGSALAQCLHGLEPDALSVQ